jgi:hypothetical protein
MTTIKAYLYPNVIEYQILDTQIFSTRNRIVYSRPIKVYQGIDNPIQIIVRNQDQKPVDLTGYAVQVDIQDPTNGATVKSFGVNFLNISLGQGAFIIDKMTLNSLEQRFYWLTIKTINQATNAEAPAYIDDNYGVPLDLEVLPAYYSSTVPNPGIDNSIIDGGVIPNTNLGNPGLGNVIIDGGVL